MISYTGRIRVAMFIPVPFDNWPNCNTGLQMVWVEGIGSINDLFYNLNFPNPLIICLAQYNFLSIDSFGANIHLLTTTSEAITSSPNKVWISNRSTLHSEDMIKSVAIFDLCGRCLFVQSDVARTDYELHPIQYYSEGIYIIKVITAAGSANFTLVK